MRLAGPYKDRPRTLTSGIIRLSSVSELSAFRASPMNRTGDQTRQGRDRLKETKKFSKWRKLGLQRPGGWPEAWQEGDEKVEGIAANELLNVEQF